MRNLLARHPLLVSAIAASLVLLSAAFLVLPRLDGIEIRSVDRTAAGAADVEVAYRLASAPSGTLSIVLLPREGEQRRTRVRVTGGHRTRTLQIDTAGVGEALIIAELQPTGMTSGLLARLQQGRRRSVAALPDAAGVAAATPTGR